MAWNPGWRLLELGTQAQMRGSLAATRVTKNEPKLLPNAPIFCGSISGRAVSQSTAVGKAAVDWLTARPEIDPQKIGAFGNSFGSFFVTLVAANEPRICACVPNSNNLQPGFHAIFEEASPSYKKRFMYMAGFTDEAKFDAFRKTLTWEGHAEKIRVPYLCVAGEWDELSPMIHTERMLSRMSNPRRLVVYQEARHAIGSCPSVNLGPHPPTLVPDWMAQRFAGVPMANERWHVDNTGEVTKTPLYG